jgi:hypothetical protein
MPVSLKWIKTKKRGKQQNEETKEKVILMKSPGLSHLKMYVSSPLNPSKLL